MRVRASWACSTRGNDKSRSAAARSVTRLVISPERATAIIEAPSPTSPTLPSSSTPWVNIDRAYLSRSRALTMPRLLDPQTSRQTISNIPSSPASEQLRLLSLEWRESIGVRKASTTGTTIRPYTPAATAIFTVTTAPRLRTTYRREPAFSAPVVPRARSSITER